MQKIIVVSGLPGSGKSMIAEGLSRELSLPIFSIDPIEAAMWRSGIDRNATGIAAYEIAATLADEHIKLGHSVVIDAVSPVEAARDMWRKVATDNRGQLVIIEVICSDEQVHKQRIEKRVRNIPGMPEVTWERVQQRKREFEPWQDEHLTLDSIEKPEALVSKAVTYAQKVS
ncbi:MAG TPA: AAA family ATPase [Candidatus Saccharimonadales bacterium]|nr:AAA family ATPase [Candidatus Saccharimonadales bacterium]